LLESTVRVKVQAQDISTLLEHAYCVLVRTNVLLQASTNKVGTNKRNYSGFTKNVRDQVTKTNILFFILKLLKYRSRLNAKAHLYGML